MASNTQLKIYRLDSRAQEQAQEHLHLASLLACQQYRRCRRTVPLDELCGEAQFALSDAAARYDQRRGVPFGAFVTLVIRRHLARAVTLWRRGGRLDFVRFSELAAGGARDRPAFDVVCPNAPEPSNTSRDRELVDRVRRVLPARWFGILQLYYVDDYPLEAIAQRLGISRERARQLLAKALARARRLVQAG